MTLKRVLLSIITTVITLNCFAGDGDYAVSKIPEALMKGADVVVRVDETHFEVVNLGKSVTKRKHVITILNENGDGYAYLYLGYNLQRSISNIDGSLYDATGKKIKTLKKGDIKDLSATDEGTLADDSRYKLFSFFHKVYPYTVEYEYTLQDKGTYGYPIWQPIHREKYAVEQSALIITVPSDFTFRYKMFNYKSDPIITTEKSIRRFKWEVKDLPPIELEYASPSWDYIVPTVYTAPTKFQIDKYQGDMSTWEEYGKFRLLLNKDRDKLPDYIIKEVHLLTDTVQDARKKVRILYEYLQKNTRYISIQFGIGGLQPFDASYVAEKKYGDCKALSNYMCALLKEAGIKSHYTLVHAGDGETYFIDDFPFHQFNHIIVCVPIQKDTIWLECTNQTLPAGYLSGFTSDRSVLLVDESGGKLVKTPKYSKQQNLQVRKIEGRIGADGMLTMNVSSAYSALQQDRRHRIFNSLSRDKQMEFLKEQIDLPHYDVVNFSFTEDKAALPTLKENLEIKASNYASQTGKRLFITPNIISRTYSKLKPSENRKYPIALGMDFIDVDTTVLEIPSGYAVEALPQALKLESKFGKFQCSTELKENKLVYYRYIEKNGGEYPASDYNDLVKFHDQIYKVDRSRVVLVKKE